MGVGAFFCCQMFCAFQAGKVAYKPGQWCQTHCPRRSIIDWINNLRENVRKAEFFARECHCQYMSDNFRSPLTVWLVWHRWSWDPHLILEAVGENGPVTLLKSRFTGTFFASQRLHFIRQTCGWKKALAWGVSVWHTIKYSHSWLYLARWTTFTPRRHHYNFP